MVKIKTKLMLILQKILFDSLTSQKTYLAEKMNIVCYPNGIK